MKTKQLLFLLILMPAVCVAEKDFFGEWTPPQSLAAFWKPLNQAWWNPDDNSRVYNYCKRFASTSDPNCLVKDIIDDLRRHPSVPRTSVYSMLIVNWDSRVTLKLLKPYYESKDVSIHKIASDFIADIEETNEGHL